MLSRASPPVLVRKSRRVRESYHVINSTDSICSHACFQQPVVMHETNQAFCVRSHDSKGVPSDEHENDQQ